MIWKPKEKELSEEEVIDLDAKTQFLSLEGAAKKNDGESEATFFIKLDESKNPPAVPKENVEIKVEESGGPPAAVIPKWKEFLF